MHRDLLSSFEKMLNVFTMSWPNPWLETMAAFQTWYDELRIPSLFQIER